MKEALDIGVHTILTAEASVKDAKSRRGSSIMDPPEVDHYSVRSGSGVVNPFGDAVSVLTEHQQYGAPPAQKESRASYYGNSGPSAPQQQAQPEPRQQQQPQQQQQQQHQQQQQQQQYQSQQNGPSDDSMEMLQNLKDAAEQAEKDARSATDHSQALALQFEDIRRDFDDINQVANEKQNAKFKKKGFLKGGKKEHQKEIEAAMLLAEQKSREVQKAHDNLRMAQDNAARMNEEASQKRSQADAYEIDLSNYLTRAQFSQEPLPATLSQEEFGAAARGNEYGATSSSYQHRSAPSYGSFGDANMSYDNSGAAPMGMGGYASTPARPVASGQALMGGNPNEGLMGGPSGYYNQNTSTMPTAGQNQNFNDTFMGGAPAPSNANGASVAHAAFPTESSLAGTSNAGLSYASAKYSTNDTINTGLSYIPDETNSLGGSRKPSDAGSYVSVQEAMKPAATGINYTGITSIQGDASYDARKPSDASITGMSNAGSYVSVQEANYGARKPSDASITGMSNTGSYVSVQEGSNLDTIPIVAPLPTTEYNAHTGYATDSSIQGSVSRAGTISGYNTNLNPDYATDASVQGSASRSGTISGYNSDSQPATSAFPLLPQKTSSDGSNDGFDGIPSPEKGDTFEQNGGFVSYDQSLNNTASVDPSASQNKSFDSGIPTPTASNDDNFYSGAAWGGASQQPVASYQSEPITYADQNPNLEHFVYDSVHEATDLMANAKLENEGTIGNQHAPNVNPKVQTMGFSDQPGPPLDDGGIPTPTASNDEYAKFFG